MSADNTPDDAIGLLQQLGFKEYEARCFVGLSRLNTGTAKQLSDITEVPRTRVYDAIRVLEAQGLVEIQHSSPQRFRAVPISEAAEMLRNQYDARIDRLASTLADIDTVGVETEAPAHEVWTLSGTDAIATRSSELIDNAIDEVVLVLGDDLLLTDKLITNLTDLDVGVDLRVGAVTEQLEAQIHDAVPEATTFLSGIEWLQAADDSDDDLKIGRLLLVDRSELLVSTLAPDTQEEQAIFGEGLRNGLIVIAHRLLSQGLLPKSDPRRD